MNEKVAIARDYVEIPIEVQGQEWLMAWYPPADAPDGTPHGSAGICLTEDDHVILISNDRNSWDLPAGRPEGNETWVQTLRREMQEEACATVTDAQLLGFSRGRCVRGNEEGLILVRAIWLAHVDLGEWIPEYEVLHRKLVPKSQAMSQLLPTEYEPIVARAFEEAGRVW